MENQVKNASSNEVTSQAASKPPQGMASSEGLELGAPTIAPREALVGSAGNGIYSPNSLLMS